MPRQTRVLILGTGAMACAIGARLARSGRAAVTLVGTWAEALRAIAASGIRVEDSGVRYAARVETTDLCGAPAMSDFVLVLVKSQRTAAVAGVGARALGPSGLLVSLQNGLGNGEILGEVAGASRVALGVTTMGAGLLGPGRVRVFPGRIVLASQSPKAGRIAPLAGLFRDSGIETEENPSIDQVVWRKLAVNCAINPLTALTGLPNGGLLEDPGLRSTLTRAAREVAEVAAAKGIALGADAAALAVQVAEATAGNRSSMLRDLERGAPTEIEALNGAVVREATALNVPTPVNEALWRHVRRRERHPLPLPQFQGATA